MKPTAASTTNSTSRKLASTSTENTNTNSNINHKQQEEDVRNDHASPSSPVPMQTPELVRKKDATVQRVQVGSFVAVLWPDDGTLF